MNVKKLTVGMVAAALLVIGACSNQKGPATEAVAAAERALAEIRTDAAKFLPQDLQGVETSLASLKDSLAKEDYTSVLSSAPALTSGIGALGTSLAAKREQNSAAVAEWASYAVDVPNLVSALQSRVDVLSSAKRLPKGLDATTFTTVKSDLEMTKAKWVEASAAFDNGNAIDAVTAAKEAKSRGETLLRQLGMSPA